MAGADCSRQQATETLHAALPPAGSRLILHSCKEQGGTSHTAEGRVPDAPQQEAETTRLSAGKIAAIVAVGVVVALLLLLLLFSGDSGGEMESTQPLTVT